MAKVTFNYNDRQLPLAQKQDVKAFIGRIFNEEKKPLIRLDYIFCSDEELLEINRSYLKHDDYTDIITFDLSENTVEIIGEIYISVDRVRENAILHNTRLEEEIWRVLFHGALHLCGYTDKKKDDIAVMRKKEDYYITLYKSIRST